MAAILGVLMISVVFLQTAVGKPASSQIHAPQDLSSVRCYVVAGMIIVIPKTVTNQTTQDVLNSMLLSQLAADKKYDRNTALTDWLNFFDTTAGHVCWNVGSGKFGDISVKGSQFTIADLATQEMAKDSGFSPHVPTFQKILDIVKKLPTASAVDKILRNKTYNATSHNTAVTFGYFTKTASSSALSVLMIGLSGVKVSSTNSLFQSYKTSDVKTKKMDLNHYVFNSDCYTPQLRKQITDKLGDRVKTYIVEVKLK